MKRGWRARRGTEGKTVFGLREENVFRGENH